MKPLWIVACLALCPADLLAQSVPDAAPSTRIVLPPPAPFAPAQSGSASRRDSLKNGVVIGAVIGGLALGTFGAVLCNALQEPGDPPCWRGVLIIGGVGAGIGAAAGAGVDALFARSPSARLSPRLQITWRHPMR